MMLIFTSFIGYVVENAYKLYRSGYIDNRYMFLPFLIGYGMFTVALGLIFGTPKNMLPILKKPLRIRAPLNYLVYFLASALLVTVGELALGHLVELVAGFSYWNYSKLPLHFTKYTSLPTSLGFGFIITLFMGFVYEPAMRLFETKMKTRPWHIASVVLTLLLVADYFLSFAIMIADGEKLTLWRLYIFE